MALVEVQLPILVLAQALGTAAAHLAIAVELLTTTVLDVKVLSGLDAKLLASSRRMDYAVVRKCISVRIQDLATVVVRRGTAVAIPRTVEGVASCLLGT